MPDKACIRCQGPFKAYRHQLRCDPCRAVYKRDPFQLLKISSGRAVRSAIRAGRLTRQPCERCGKAPAQAHHDDYAKPLDVRWLCSIDHAFEHSGFHDHDGRPRPYRTQ